MIQKGNRYFWRINNEINFSQGFKSKQECDSWIDEKRNQYGFDYRCGFMVKFRSEQVPWYLVDKNNKEIKAF